MNDMASLPLLLCFGGAAWGMVRFIWVVLWMIREEAVLGGNACHSPEHAMPETTPKSEQRD